MLEHTGDALGMKTVVREVATFADAAQPEGKAPSPRLSQVVGLDLGQVSDYSALAVLETTETTDPVKEQRRVKYHAVRFLRRWQLATAYTDIVEDVVELMAQLPGAVLVIDATGVGRAVVDLFKRAGSPRLVPVTITAGDTVRHDADGWHLAKKQLVSVVQAALQTRRLKVAPELPDTRTLQRELSTFRVKVSLAS